MHGGAGWRERWGERIESQADSLMKPGPNAGLGSQDSEIMT